MRDKPLTKKTADHSNEGGYSFSFFCDVCGKEWKSPFVHRKNNRADEQQIAFENANHEAHYHFNYCPVCGKWVCDECWIENSAICKECSAKRSAI